MSFSIHGPAMASVAAMAISLGMKDSVISLICVAAWKMPTSSPTTSATSSMGAASSRVISSACVPMVMTDSGVMGLLEVAGCERAHHQRPSVHQHEQHDLEGQRNQHWREHHHAHGHQHAGYHQV